MNEEIWSAELFDGQGYLKPIAPSPGMFLSRVEKFKMSAIPTWIKMLNVDVKKAVKLMPGSNSKYKQYKCTCDACTWELSILRRADKAWYRQILLLY